MIIDIKSVEHFEDVIANNELVLIKMGAPWCAPCKTLDKTLEVLSTEEDVVIAKINVDDVPELAGSFEVMTVPTTLVNKNGQYSLPATGNLSLGQLKDMLANG